MSRCQPTVLPLSFNRMSPISLSYTILASLSHTEDSGAVWEGGREVKPFPRTHHCCLSTHSTQGATLDPLALPLPHPCSAALSPGPCVCQRCSMESNLASLDTKVRATRMDNVSDCPQGGLAHAGGFQAEGPQTSLQTWCPCSRPGANTLLDQFWPVGMEPCEKTTFPSGTLL